MTESETIEERALRVWDGLSEDQKRLYNKRQWLLTYHDDIDPDKLARLLAERAGEKLGGVAQGMSEMGSTVIRTTGSLKDFAAAFFANGDTVSKAVNEKRCIGEPLGCGQALLNEDGSWKFVLDTKEQAEAFEREWRITGLCPDCQNAVQQTAEELAEEDEPEDFEYGTEPPNYPDCTF